MGTMKSKLGMLSLMAVAMSGMEYAPSNQKTHREPKEPIITDEEKKRMEALAQIEQYKRNGLTQFFYGENSVWAINQKNADRKARSKHWL